jgi:uncharacterized membrane protein
MLYSIFGLIVCIVAAVLLAFVNSTNMSQTHAWLHALQSSIDSKPAAVTAHDRTYAQSLNRSAKWSLWGWLLLAAGMLLQIVAILAEKYPTVW